MRYRFLAASPVAAVAVTLLFAAARPMGFTPALTEDDDRVPSPPADGDDAGGLLAMVGSFGVEAAVLAGRIPGLAAAAAAAVTAGRAASGFLTPDSPADAEEEVGEDRRAPAVLPTALPVPSSLLLAALLTAAGPTPRPTPGP